MKPRLLQHWNAVRLLRLLIGVAVMVQAVLQKDYVLLLAGSMLALLALVNAGCCGTCGCTVRNPPAQQTKKHLFDEVDTRQ